MSEPRYIVIEKDQRPEDCEPVWSREEAANLAAYLNKKADGVLEYRIQEVRTQ